MPTLSTQSQTIITNFGQQPGVTQDQVNNLRSIINSSPALIDQVNNAVAQGHLTQIVPLTNPNAGGEYDNHAKDKVRVGPPLVFFILVFSSLVFWRKTHAMHLFGSIKSHIFKFLVSRIVGFTVRKDSEKQSGLRLFQ